MPPPAAGQPDKDILVVSYRDHHNAYSPDDPNVTFVNLSKKMTAPRRLLQYVFTGIMVHYFLWIIPMVWLLYFFYTLGLWPISVLLLSLYLPTFLNNDQFKSGRPWHAFRMHPLWKLASRYVGVEVVRTTPLDAKQKYVFALYPHGILILSRIAMYGGAWERCFPGIETRVLGASPMFWVPGSREICLWMGAVNAAKKVAMNALNKFGLNLMVYPGGSDEIFTTDPSSPVTTLIVRKGFIKLSIQAGAAIVPAFVFGEKWLYRRKSISEGVKRWFMRYLRMPLILFWGRLGWLPYHDTEKAFLSVVFGRPISVRQESEPSEEYIDQVWREYLGQVRAIFDEYKDRYGYPKDERLELQEAKSERRRGGAGEKAGQQQPDKKKD